MGRRSSSVPSLLDVILQEDSVSLSSTINKVIYSGNGVTTIWPFSFPVFEADHLSVILTDAQGHETQQSSGAYRIAGVGDPNGGSVTYPLNGDPLPPAAKLTILRTVPYTQSTVLANQGGYYPEVVERRFDEIYMALQQLDERVGRASLHALSDATTEQSNLKLIQALQPMNVLGARGDLLTHDAVAYRRFARGVPGQFLSVSGNDLAWTAPPSSTGMRQTVLGGPADGAGLPSFLPASSAGLTLSTQNVTALAPLVIAAARGFGPGGPADRIGYSTFDLTWYGLGSNTTNYLYVDVGGDGTLVTGSTVRSPVYQWGGAYETTAGQHTFNITDMTMKIGEGAIATSVWRVFVGEATTSPNDVTSTVAYAYRGQYESTFTQTLPGAGVPAFRNHNIGVLPRQGDFIAECTTVDAAYAIGDQVGMGTLSGWNGAVQVPNSLYRSRVSIGVIGPSSPWYLLNKLNGTGALLTLSRWRYKFVASRGW